MNSKALIFMVLAAFSLRATGDTVYKCVDPAGKVTFSGMPCGEGAEKREIQAPPATQSPSKPRLRATEIKMLNDIEAQREEEWRQQQIQAKIRAERRKTRAMEDLASEMADLRHSMEMRNTFGSPAPIIIHQPPPVIFNNR